QEELGLWHDYVVLAECAMQASIDAQLALHDGTTQRNIIELVRFALKSAQRHLDRFVTLWGEQGKQLAETIRQACPLTEPVTPSQTDPGPADSAPPPGPEAASTVRPPAA